MSRFLLSTVSPAGLPVLPAILLAACGQPTVGSGPGGASDICGEPATPISAIQGSGSASPRVGDRVSIEGVVIGDFQESRASKARRPELGGFFVQEQDADSDGDTATSEGLFVFDPDKTREVAEGDLVRVTGTVGEFAGNTQLERIAEIVVCATGQVVTPALVDLPVPPAFGTIDEFWERYEGMWVKFGDVMTVTGQSDLARFGQLHLSEGGRLRQYGQDGSLPLTRSAFEAATRAHARRSVTLDDFNTQQNVDPVHYPGPGGFAVDHFVRLGATVPELSGVLNFTFGKWTVQPRRSAPVAFEMPGRPPVPDPGGNLTVGVMNARNYFNGNGRGGGFPTARGAHSAAEFRRQTDKLVAALATIDADVLGLLELENDGDTADSALASLVGALNAALGAGSYDWVRAGLAGGADEITAALIYQPAEVSPVGPAGVLAAASFTDPTHTGRQRNRPALAQSFCVSRRGHPDAGAVFTAVVLHLKSQGSPCGPGDDSPFQGRCNGTRTRAVRELLNWLATDPTGTRNRLGVADPDVLVIGDLNSYRQQDPLQAFYRSGYADVLPQSGHTFVFDGAAGTLDHVLASPGMSGQVTGHAVWNINSDENSLLDYNDPIRDAGEESFAVKPAMRPLYAPNAFRSSDHDPVWVGLDLDAPPTSIPGPAGSGGPRNCPPPAARP